MTWTSYDICPYCQGTGDDGAAWICLLCDGSGMREYRDDEPCDDEDCDICADDDEWAGTTERSG